MSMPCSGRGMRGVSRETQYSNSWSVRLRTEMVSRRFVLSLAHLVHSRNIWQVQNVHLIVCRLWSSRSGKDPARRWFSRFMWNSCMSRHSHGESGYGDATEPANDGLAIPSASDSPDRNVGVTGVCGYPIPVGIAGQGSTRSVNG